MIKRSTGHFEYMLWYELAGSWVFYRVTKPYVASRCTQYVQRTYNTGVLAAWRLMDNDHVIAIIMTVASQIDYAVSHNVAFIRRSPHAVGARRNPHYSYILVRTGTANVHPKPDAGFNFFCQPNSPTPPFLNLFFMINPLRDPVQTH